MRGAHERRCRSPFACSVGSADPAVRRPIVVTLHDDVREVFATDHAFGVPYKPKLDVIMGGEPFFLGMGGRAPISRRHGRHAQGRAARGLPMLGDRVEALAERSSRLGRTRSRWSTLVRHVTFDLSVRIFRRAGASGRESGTSGARDCSNISSSRATRRCRPRSTSIAPALRSISRTRSSGGEASSKGRTTCWAAV